MNRYAVALALLALAGCRAETHSQADNTFVCSAKPPYSAFRAKPGAGDITFLERQPDADPLCAR